MVTEEFVCTHCGIIFDCDLGGAPRTPRNQVVCLECYPLFEYQEIDRSLLSICKREKISLKNLGERIRVLIKEK